ncbi:proteasome subunit alpha, partial [Streptomyces nigra]
KFKRIVGRQLDRLLEAGGAATEAESSDESEGPSSGSEK